jgi:hypothetical protein
MNGKLRDHIDALFSEAPDNQKTVEIKEEILQNLYLRYNDLISQGKSEEAAYNITIAGIGDISGLVKELKEKAGKRSGGADEQSRENNRQRSALVYAISTMLYILSVIPLFLFGKPAGAILLFVMVAAATGLLVYYNSLPKPNRRECDDTMAEEFQKWREDSSQKKNMIRSISSALWLITVALYFLVSFTTGAWYITWIIFLIAAAVDNVVKAVFDLRR